MLAAGISCSVTGDTALLARHIIGKNICCSCCVDDYAKAGNSTGILVSSVSIAGSGK